MVGEKKLAVVGQDQTSHVEMELESSSTDATSGSETFKLSTGPCRWDSCESALPVFSSFEVPYLSPQTAAGATVGRTGQCVLRSLVHEAYTLAAQGVRMKKASDQVPKAMPEDSVRKKGC
eukprot:6488686-Amphidinium_carterae.2